jgi:rhodanese-related sulfurtransferase
LLDGSEGCVYLDVRTVSEFEAGHVPGALNIPVAQVNPATGGMEMNDEFIPVVVDNIPKDAHVIVGCKTGGRSAKAVRAMLDAGYGNVVNMTGGFLGKRDADGRIELPGWWTLAYPIERGEGNTASYEYLRKKSGP